MTQVEAPGIRVPKREGEAVRRRLLEADLLRTDLKPGKDADNLFFPVDVEGAAWEGFQVEPMAFEAQKATPPPYQERVDLPPDLKALLPTSFDVIGHVLILKLPDELLPHRDAIGAALLAAQKSVDTVALDRGVTGELRVRDLEVIAGEPTTETEHREFGVRLLVDPATCYFSPRLATERKRVAGLVEPGERVVDLMAGVAPFALVIARHAQPARVDAVDLNAAAVRYAEENVRRNRADGVVLPVCADARAWAAEHPGVADRVITNIPHTAHEFLEDALKVLKPEGGTWHYHAIRAEEDLPAHYEELRRRAEAVGRSVEVVHRREVRTYSPTERHYAIDVRVT